MDAELKAEVEFGNGKWIQARARRIRKNLYMVLMPPFCKLLPAGFYKNPPPVGILLEAIPATYVHSEKMWITQEAEIVLLAATDPDGPQPVRG
jgi:hypothetical protein